MTEEEQLIKKRLLELARKSDGGGYYTFSDFLGVAEQSLFAQIKPSLRNGSYAVFGGAEGCERIMVRFGDSDDIGYEVPYPISVIKVEPKAAKFADKLTHRDFLGAILNLGIERKTLGDIVIRDNVGYIFANESISEYIASSLERVKRTDVKNSIIDSIPEGELFKTEERSIQISGERLDAIVAKVFSLSREEAQSLFKKRLVFVSGRLTENVSYTPKENETVSVRGFGRFIYKGVYGLSKKGKLNVSIQLYV